MLQQFVIVFSYFLYSFFLFLSMLFLFSLFCILLFYYIQTALLWLHFYWEVRASAHVHHSWVHTCTHAQIIYASFVFFELSLLILDYGLQISHLFLKLLLLDVYFDILGLFVHEFQYLILSILKLNQ